MIICKSQKFLSGNNFLLRGHVEEQEQPEDGSQAWRSILVRRDRRNGHLISYNKSHILKFWKRSPPNKNRDYAMVYKNYKHWVGNYRAWELDKSVLSFRCHQALFRKLLNWRGNSNWHLIWRWQYLFTWLLSPGHSWLEQRFSTFFFFFIS